MGKMIFGGAVFVWALLAVASIVAFGVWGYTWWAPLLPTPEGVLRMMILIGLHLFPIWIAFAATAEAARKGRKP